MITCNTGGGTKYSLVCDGCSRRIDSDVPGRKTKQIAASQGWACNNGHGDWCPACAPIRKEIKAARQAPKPPRASIVNVICTSTGRARSDAEVKRHT